MNLALGRFHLAIYLDAPIRNPLLTPISIARPDVLERTYLRESRLDAVEADRQRWCASYSAQAGWRP